MLWRSNEGKDPASNGENEQLNSLKQDRSDTVQKAYDDVKTLRETVNQLREKRDDLSQISTDLTETKLPEKAVTAEPKAWAGQEELEAAQQAIEEQLRKDAREQMQELEKRLQREQQKLIDQKEIEEAQKRLAEKKRESQRLRQVQIEAERKAAAVRRKQRLADIEAKKKADDKVELPAQIQAQREAEIMQKRKLELEKKHQEEHEKLVAQQRKLLAQQQKLLQEEQRKIREQQRKAAEQQRKRDRQRLIEEERRLQRERREKADAEIRQIKAEQEAQRREQRHERAKQIKAERARKSEIRKQNKLAKHSAELGGGIVNVHGVKVKTEIEPVAAYSWKDIVGFVSKKEKRAAESEEELRELLEERERTKDEARQVASRLAELRRIRRQNSTWGRRYLAFRDFCDAKKKPLLVGFACLLMVLVGIAGVINFYTVLEYSYNGKALGYVNNRDNVLQITNLVSEALTEDKNIRVVIDARDDISFRRVADFGRNLTVDSSDDVLKRLTYMGNLNVKAYGIYIDGQKVGTVKDKQTAADVLQDIKDRYQSNKSGTELEEAVIVEDIQVRRINSDLEDLSTEGQMVETLCTSGQKETVHKVVVGETLADIALNYGTTEKQLLEDNPGVDPKKLEVGSSLIIRTSGPIMTVRMTEVRTYDKTIKYKTEKKKDKEMYEGYSELEQEGKNGRMTLTDRTISINGEVVETENLKTEVTKKAVPKIIRVGTKERPPTVGSGKFIWPAQSGTYTLTSTFKWRWGRHHDGIDLGCHEGNIVMAADGGTVTYAGYMGGYGLLVIIDHQNGMESYYAHNSSLTVGVGSKVYQGQQIAYSGNTGNSTGPHIHFGIKVNGAFVDPLSYLP